jgi:DNA-binding GntR family transcriptional regulator
MAFHVLLLRGSGNSRMMRIVADSRVLLRIFGARRQEHDLAVLRQTYQFHSQILDAVRAADAAAATAAMTDHIHASMRETLEHYDRVHAEAGAGPTFGLPEHLLEELDRVTRELEIEG